MCDDATSQRIYAAGLPRPKTNEPRQTNAHTASSASRNDDTDFASSDSRGGREEVGESGGVGAYEPRSGVRTSHTLFGAERAQCTYDTHATCGSVDPTRSLHVLVALARRGQWIGESARRVAL